MQRRQSAVGRMRLAALGRTQLQQEHFMAAEGCGQECSPWKDYLEGTKRSDKLALKQITS